MNNKTLIIIIAVLVVVGGILLIGGQLGNKNNPADKNTSSAPAANNSTSQSDDAPKGKPIKEGTLQIINVTKDGFEPASTTIKKNMVVIWINKSDKEAGISSDSHVPLNLGRFPTGSSVQLAFDKAGIYKYVNEINPSQTGTITVESF